MLNRHTTKDILGFIKCLLVLENKSEKQNPNRIPAMH